MRIFQKFSSKNDWLPGLAFDIYKSSMKNIFISVFMIFALVLNAQNDSIKVEIKNVGEKINSPYIDYAPLISADGSIMIFTSRRPLSGNKTKNLKDHIFYSNFDIKKKEWSDAIPFSDSINDPERNNSAISLLNDGQQMLIYKDDLNTNGDIYESHLSGSNWTEPENMAEPINSSDKEPSACISPDGGTIYFVSDRNGGLGGFDIWYSKKDSVGKWGEAINMGEPINTPEDEDGLFIHSDGKTLFFSSKGHNSIGGYDVFMTTLDKATNVWSTPKNLGPSINTPGDDLYFVMLADGKTGYYSSNRTGGYGEKDIYSITFLEDIMKTDLILLKGRIVDKNRNSVEAKIVVKDKVTGLIMGTFVSNSSTGKYLLTLPADKNYEIVASAEGYADYKYSIKSSDLNGFKEIYKNIVLKKLRSHQGAILAKGIEDGTLNTDGKNSKNDLNPAVFGKVLDENGNPLKVLIEVIDNNTNKVIGKYQNSVVTGLFNLKIRGGNYRIVFSKPCYLFKSIYVISSNSAGYKKDLGDINMELVGVGKKIVLDYILFDYTKAELREESYFTLDRTIRMMNTLESLEIELSGHTDNISSAEHNQMLSEERARQVMKYLVRMGIDEERIKYKGYGFTQPVASNDTKIGRQLNRRTELKILKVDLEAEQINEIQRMKEAILAQVNQSSNDDSLSKGKESKTNASIPDRFKQFDTESDGKISSSEIISAIDSFLTKNSQFNADEIIALSDYYFEQQSMPFIQ